MSSIPYNSKAYLDAKVSMTDNGTVNAGRQIQSPASAGSRGLAKLTQFTNNKTQMQLGQEAIAESMVEIRSIMNRIDGVNVPVQELDLKDLKPKASDVITYGKGGSLKYIQIEYEILGTLENMLINNSEQEVLKRIADFVTDEVGEEHVDKAMEIIQKAKDNDDGEMTFDDMINQLKSKGESAVQEDISDKGRIALEKAGFDPMKVKEYMAVFNDHGDTSDIDQMNMDKVGLADAMAMVLASHDVENESTSSDSGEMSRLKELSGIEEDAGLTDAQKKGLEAIAKKYKDREGGNGDMLAYGYLDAYVDTGITTDGYDSEEMEAYSKKIGKNSYTDWEGDDHSNFVDQSEITSAMIDDLEKVLGPEFENDAKLSSSAMEYLNSLGSNYEPMPEGDEFDIEEDEDFEEVLGALGFPEDETELFDAEYQGRKVPLNKPMRGDVKKFKVYVKDPSSGNVKKVNFGHGGTSAKRPTMRIRKSNPKARKSFRARHNCANPGPKTKARYWSCRKW